MLSLGAGHKPSSMRSKARSSRKALRFLRSFHDDDFRSGRYHILSRILRFYNRRGPERRHLGNKEVTWGLSALAKQNVSNILRRLSESRHSERKRHSGTQTLEAPAGSIEGQDAINEEDVAPSPTSSVDSDHPDAGQADVGVIMLELI